MAPNLVLYQLLLVVLVLLCLVIHVEWPDNPGVNSKTFLQPDKSRRRRFKAPTPYSGLSHQPGWKACSAYLLHALPIKQVQLDALYAMLRAVRDGDVRAVEAIERLSRSPTGMKRSVFVRFCCQPLAMQWRMACIVCGEHA